ncbi:MULTISPECIES: GntR family transcriptional regulator [Methylobacterium]|jgi:DNA-binding GntR family transcriptional regulator|uniref:GntR family transcriptional regulator n=1 Tax=Methylobacterium TaxID=407 RepID=UPI0008E44B8B|nr:MULTISPECIES: GntR family transcriptional regulator [Methylobacterium]MBZ6412941.1 GntR family transcriptional regulator [Methylobacterium sp.]MBK3396578.1 GntR family transcriptional regulator [Methylobacterium ajmalii]MBK3409226.1 GntR family transcriptional regulator [Methylobacterium ajmalii]MBK3422232.1 GntR family transcriptional regulator [Methylobacterium ajmalii]SFE97252.1 DNA-binding transcriptional regulator, GntR family [Methylobacterium sp. yr596]
MASQTDKAVKPVPAGKRLPRTTLSGQIAGQIRASILDGSYPLGAQLNEMELASAFGVSRGPVREAMQRLIQEGLLRSEPHRGVFVPELAPSDLIDIYFVRRSLELVAMRRILENADRGAVVRDLAGIVRQMKAAVRRKDWPQVADLDMQFHRRIVDEAGSERLTRSFATLQAETRLCLQMLMGGYSENAALIDEHQLLVDLIERGAVEPALAEMERHFGDPVRTLQKANASRKEKLGAEAA